MPSAATSKKVRIGVVDDIICYCKGYQSGVFQTSYSSSISVTFFPVMRPISTSSSTNGFIFSPTILFPFINLFFLDPSLNSMGNTLNLVSLLGFSLSKSYLPCNMSFRYIRSYRALFREKYRIVYFPRIIIFYILFTFIAYITQDLYVQSFDLTP